MVIGIGVDLIEIERIEKAVSQRPRFLEKVFAAEETAQCMKKGRPAASFAARFAAKEAVFKALGSGWGLGWLSVVIITDEEGKPLVQLRGRAAVRAEEMGITEVKVSLTHSRGSACAMAIALGRLQV